LALHNARLSLGFFLAVVAPHQESDRQVLKDLTSSQYRI
jgi:hypothetical protein